jgi:MATE family multidrug resistance protein
MEVLSPTEPAVLKADESISATPLTPAPTFGGSRELLKLAAPLIVSQSFMTVQVFVDTVLLAWHDQQEMAAALPAVMWYWLLFTLLQVTAGYTSTFVAQYTGAGRPHRVGPAVWQGIHFAVLTGFFFFLVAPAAPWLISLSGHADDLQILQTTYLRCLAFAAMPMLIMGAVNGFFSGRGQTVTVLGIEAFGTAVNVALALVLIFGRAGFSEMGIEGAGWATVAGSWASALCAVVLFLQPQYAREFATISGWRIEADLFRRLMRYGGPAGLQMFLDVLVFHLFLQMVGRLGKEALGATALTVRLNMIAFLPMLGLGQAVSIVVGQCLGANRPDWAEKSTYIGLRWSFGYMAMIALVYLTMPRLLVSVFEGTRGPEEFAAIAAIVPNLLVCVAIYSLADSVNLTFAFALRGAGDTWFVSLLTFFLAWPLMVVPTYIVMTLEADVIWAWVFATIHIVAMSVCFAIRFRSGKWKSMRVIETAPPEEGNEHAITASHVS